MLTTTVRDDTITPHYPCGATDKSVDLRHGSRFAEYRIVKNADKHSDKCATCRAYNDAATIQFDDDHLDLLELLSLILTASQKSAS